MTSEDLPLRQAVRAVMIDHRDRILLVKLDLSFTDWVGWVLPGGGLEAGEDHISALRRELREETGLTNAFVGPVICRVRHIATSVAPGFGGQEEDIYLVPCHDFALEPALAEHELRGEGIVDMRWFTVAELHAIPETVAPPNLVGLVERVLEHGGSVEPLLIEVNKPPG